MAEEFQESDVLFSDYDRDHDQDGGGGCFTYQELVMSSTSVGNNNGGGMRVARNSGKNCKKKKKKSPPSANSVPVDINIPDNLFRYVDLEEEYEEDGSEEIIPPHVIVGRRLFAGKMAFSVCTGNGRTLKGRDLSQVRNSILRMTGFLET